MRKLIVSLSMWAFIVFVPAHISFAYTTSQYPGYQYGNQYGQYGNYGNRQYQLYWCNGYYSYSPCQQQYYYYPTYYYPYPSYGYFDYYYPSSTYNTNYNGNYNYNYNYNVSGGYFWY